MFHKKLAPPTFPVDYPSGVCVDVNGARYYINGKLRHPVIGLRIFESWRFPFVVESSEEALKNYIVTKKLGFRDGTLVRTVSDNKLYFIAKGLRRPVENPDALLYLGLRSKDAIVVSTEEINLHKDGEPLK